MMKLTVQAIYLSRAHNYFGHHGGPAGETPMEAVEAAELVAGQGIVGDRFYGYKEDYRGQVTFISAEVYAEVCATLGVQDRGAEVLRRNILVSGGDLNELIGQTFEVQGLRFLGMAECTPCHWMDQALGAGAEAGLHGRGGLRAKVLVGGTLRAER